MSRPSAPRPRASARPASPTTSRPTDQRPTPTHQRPTTPTHQRSAPPLGIPTPLRSVPTSPRGAPTSRPAARTTTSPRPPAARSTSRGAPTSRPSPRGTPSPRSGAAALRATAEAARSTAIDGAPRWISGLLAGAQAALLSVVVVVMPALAAYVATSADPVNADVGWPQSVAVGAVLWLLGHGAVVQSGDATISIVPLGVTALAVFAAFASARRSAHPTRGAWLAGIGGYLGVVALVLALVGSAGPLGAGPGSVARTMLGAAAVSSLGIGLGVLRPGGLREVTRPVWSRVHPLIRAAGAAGVMVVAILVAVSALVTVGWLIAGRAAAGDVIDGLGLDVFGGALLAGAQLTVAPNLVLWVLAWVAGPGFSLGAGTLYSPTEVIGGPLPALPMLGALPADGVQGAATAWIPLAVIAAGAVAGWWLQRQIEVRSGNEPFLAAAGAAVGAGATAGVLSLLAAGSAGPGRLTVVGASAGSVALTVAGLSLVGLLVALVPTDHLVRERFVHGCRTIAARLRRDAAGSGVRAAAGITPPADG